MSTKVLVVDDAPDVRRLIQLKLKKAGFDVITAFDGQDGWEKARAEDPDVVLLETMMPRMDGLTAAQKIKAETNLAPISLIVTAKGQEEDVMKGLSSSADDQIIKSFASRDVISRVSVALIQAGKKITFDDWGLGIEGSE